MSSEAKLSTVYCTDEDIYVRCYGDFATLVPKDQVLAMGADGAFAADDPWTLTSASNDFGAQGIAVGHVFQLTGPVTSFKGGGTKFAVGAVAGNSVTLRVCGKPDGIGMPPSPAGGLTGVSFIARTFDPQIEDVSYQINQRFGIDEAWALSAPNLIYDLRVLRQATALSVLVRAYTCDARSKDGDFAAKLGRFKQDLSDAMAIAQVRWNQATDTPPPTSLFRTRISR